MSSPSRLRSTLVLAGLGLAGACLFAGYLAGRVLRPSIDPFVSAPRDGEVRREAVLPSFSAAVERTMPGVVAVRAIVPADTRRLSATEGHIDLLGPEDGPTASPKLALRDGSGFVVRSEGLVVTARHLTVRALRLLVEVPNHGNFPAKLVGEDEVTDLAVLRIDQPPEGLVPLELGHSEDIRAGDWIVTVGNPYGFRQTVTAGIVSFVGRHISSDDLRPSSEFLQFSAPVNPGSSGCPVVDLSGRVVGVTTQAAQAAEGISFAIPSRTLKWTLEAMDKSPDGRVHRGRMGVSLQPRPGKDASGKPLPGVLVGRVLDGEPAHRAGLQPDDVVLAVDERAVSDSNDLHERITCSAPGTRLRLRVLRDGRPIPDVDVLLADATEPTPKEPIAR